jgi:hypothetical protein
LHIFFGIIGEKKEEEEEEGEEGFPPKSPWKAKILKSLRKPFFSLLLPSSPYISVR